MQSIQVRRRKTWQILRSVSTPGADTVFRPFAVLSESELTQSPSNFRRSLVPQSCGSTHILWIVGHHPDAKGLLLRGIAGAPDYSITVGNQVSTLDCEPRYDLRPSHPSLESDQT
jgi:hypothetical protein